MCSFILKSEKQSLGHTRPLSCILFFAEVTLGHLLKRQRKKLNNFRNKGCVGKI